MRVASHVGTKQKSRLVSGFSQVDPQDVSSSWSSTYLVGRRGGPSNVAARFRENPRARYLNNQFYNIEWLACLGGHPQQGSGLPNLTVVRPERGVLGQPLDRHFGTPRRRNRS